MVTKDLTELFWSHVDIGNPNECWPWKLSLKDTGYGQWGIWDRTLKKVINHYAHRLAYSFGVGPIPDGYQVDHECHNRDSSCRGGKKCFHRKCCNPNHLVAKTQQDNIRLGKGGDHWRRKTHCPHGHRYSEANTYVSPRGSRECRTCKDGRR